MPFTEIKKIFIGNQDIASQIQDFKIGFNKLGVKTLTAKYYNNTLQGSKVDYNVEYYKALLPRFRPTSLYLGTKAKWGKLVEEYLLRKAIKECDVFLFIWSTFKEDLWDIPYLKKLNKKILFFFCGDDVRWPNAMEQEFKKFHLSPFKYNYIPDKIYLQERLRFLRYAEKYADFIYAGVPSMQLALRPYNHFYIPMNMSVYKGYDQPQRKIPLILHAPSNRSLKGSEKIIETLKRLKNEGGLFEYKLLEQMPFEDALNEYRNADILVGQLFGPLSGKQERELLSMGKIVVSSFKRDYLKYNQPSISLQDHNYIDDCPILDITNENMYEKLKEIIYNLELRIKLAKKGQEYIKKYHSSEIVCANILQNLTSKKESEISPTFFRNDFAPELENIETYNSFTHFVKDCDWYKSHVKPGERAGLVF